MKKIISLTLALLMIISSSLICLADDTVEGSDEGGITDEFESVVTFECDATDIEKGYNYGSEIEIVYQLEITNLPEASAGISIVYLNLSYDGCVLTPAIVGSEDEDGDPNDYTAYVSGGPDEWVAFGTILGDGSSIEVCYWDDMSETTVNEGDVICFTVPFKVNDPQDCMIADVDFNSTTVSVAFCDLYENDITTVYHAEAESLTLYRAIQPELREDLPENAHPLHVAGYRHAANNVIWYADADTTVGEYIESYMEITNNQQDMNYFAIAIVDAESGKVVYADTQIGRPQSDKSAVVIPENHYIIGVNGNNTTDYEAFCEQISVGAYIDVYNVNIDATKNAIPEIDLDGAGFEIVDPAPVPKEDASVIFDEENGEIFVYENDITVSEFKDLFDNEITVIDKYGDVVADDELVESGMKIEAIENIDIIVMGDVNGDGLVNQYDYILIKRHYLGTYTLEGVFFKAACLNDGVSVGVYDYIYVKRAYFGTLDLAVLCEKG